MEEEAGGPQVGLRQSGEGEDEGWSRTQGETPYLLGWKKGMRKGFDVDKWVGRKPRVEVGHL